MRLLVRSAWALAAALLCCAGAADASAITVNKTFTPAALGLGQASTVTVTLNNNDTTSAATITAFSDDIGTMAGGGIVNGAFGVSTTCPGGTPTIVGNVVSMNNGAIPQAPNPLTPGECTITFQVFGNKVGNSVNTIFAANVVTAPQGSPTGNVSQTLTVTAIDLPTSHTGPSTAIVGGTATISFSVTNPAGNIALTNVAFPINGNSTTPFTVAGITTTNCGAATTTSLPAPVLSGTISVSGATILPGQTCTVTLPVSSAVASTPTVNFVLPANSVADDQGVTDSVGTSTQATFINPYPTIAKAFGASAIPEGGSTTLTITITNILAVPLTNAQILDDLSTAHLTVSGATVPATTCGAGTVTAVVGSSTAQLTGGTVPPNGSCTVTLSVTGTTVANQTNIIPATNFSSNEASQAANQASASLQVTGPSGGMTIGKSASVASAPANTPFQLTLHFNSVLNDALSNGTFSDTLPALMATYADATHQPAYSPSCGAAAYTPFPFVSGASTVAGTGLAVPAGGSCTFTFWVVFPTPIAPNTNVTNTLFASTVSFTDASGTVVPPANASVTVTQLAALSISNYVAQNAGLINQPLTMQGAITDPGGTPDTGVTAVFNLTPGKVQLAANPNFQFSPTCPPGFSTANLTIGPNRESFTASIAAINATCTITYNVIDEGGASGSFTPANPTYSSPITGNVPKAFTGQNQVTFASSNINISKVFTPNIIQAGAVSTVGITLGVAGVAGFPQTQANGVNVSDNLPPAVTFAPAPNVTLSPGCQVAGQPAPSFVIAGTTITFSNISLLTVGAVPTPCTANFGVTTSIVGAPLNSIPAGAVTSTSGITNSQAVSASLIVGAGVAVEKSFVSPTTAIGGTNYIRFLLTNSATVTPLTGGSLTDTMPPQLVLASTTPGPAQAGDPPLCGGTIAGALGSSTYVANGLTIPAVVGPTPGTCVLYVLVGASATAAPGPVTNNIPPGALAIGGLVNQTPASGTVTLTAAPSPTIAKAFTPAQITAGGTSTLRISIANTAPNAAPLSGMALTDNFLPANITIAATPNAATTCGAGTVTAVAGGTSVALANGSVAANATCTITVAVTSSTNGIWTDAIPAGALTSTQGATNSAPAVAALNVGNISGVGITKDFAPVLIAPGGTSVLTIAVANTSSSAVPLTALGVTDTLPANVTVAATPNASTTCPGGTVTAVAGGTSVALSGATLAVSAACTLMLNVTGTVVGSYVNTIPAGAITSAQGSTNGAPVSATLTIGQPSLVVTKTSNPSNASVSPGEPIVYTISVKNLGTQPETNAHITDTLTNATLVGGSVTVNGSPAADAVVTAAQPFGTIAVGGTATIVYTANVNLNAATGAQVTNVAIAGGDQPCTGPSCTAVSPPNVVAPPVLTAAKLIDGAQSQPVLSGQVVTYSIAVTNTGKSPAISTVLTDPVPAGITPVPGSVTVNGAPSSGATIAGQTITVPLNTVAPGTTVTVAFQATVGSTAGTASNVASVDADGIATPISSNPATAHLVPPTIVVTKTAGATTVSVGDRVDFTIVAAPSNGVVYGTTTIVDTLPDYEIYAPGTSRVAGKPQEPVVSGHTLTWTVPSLGAPLTITYSTAIGPGAPANGTLTNNVDVSAVSPGGAPPGRGSASASVRVTGSTLGSCYPITGRVYFDANGTGRFDDPDVGLPGVHIFIDYGESVVTDSTGRYDFPCVRPGMHALRLDVRSLPAGIVPFDDRNLDSEKSTRRLVHHVYDTTIIEDINFALTGTLPAPLPPSPP